MNEQETNFQPFKVELYTVVAVIFFIAAALCVKFIQPNEAASFHKEIFPTDAISFIKDGKPLKLSKFKANPSWDSDLLGNFFRPLPTSSDLT